MSVYLREPDSVLGFIKKVELKGITYKQFVDDYNKVEKVTKFADWAIKIATKLRWRENHVIWDILADLQHRGFLTHHINPWCDIFYSAEESDENERELDEIISKIEKLKLKITKNHN